MNVNWVDGNYLVLDGSMYAGAEKSKKNLIRFLIRVWFLRENMESFDFKIRFFSFRFTENRKD